MNGVKCIYGPKTLLYTWIKSTAMASPSQSYISVNCLMEVSLAYLQTADWHLLSVELQVHSNALCSNQFCPCMYLAQGIILLIGSKSWNSWEGYLFKNHKRNAIKSFGNNSQENYISCHVLSLFHNIKDEIFFFLLECFKISDI